jgi:hypothetical protein
MNIEQAKKRFYWQRCESYNRIDAAGNKIQWKLTFNEWLQIWIDSGKYEFRGPKKGQYCMSRYNDIGDYEVENVFIQQHSENVSQSRKGKDPWNKGLTGMQVAWNKGLVNKQHLTN